MAAAKTDHFCGSGERILPRDILENINAERESEIREKR
jgi:hypothetical protein